MLEEPPEDKIVTYRNFIDELAVYNEKAMRFMKNFKKPITILDFFGSEVEHLKQKFGENEKIWKRMEKICKETGYGGYDYYYDYQHKVFCELPKSADYDSHSSMESTDEKICRLEKLIAYR